MAKSPEQAKKRLDDEYGQITRRFDEIHTAFDRVIQAKPGDDMYGLLKDLEKQVHTVRTGGWFRPGGHGYNRALKKYKKANEGASTSSGPKQTFGS
jgi:hypothetical protein